jgi:hypothetical protein
MLDFNNILSTPGIDIQTFYGDVGVANLEWKTWRKPRGAKMVYLIGVGGGGSGQTSSITNATSGLVGGGSGAQTTVLIPAQFVPDILYVQAGMGGRQPNPPVGDAAQVLGTSTWVSFEPGNVSATQTILLRANAGASLNAAGIIATIANMPRAGVGIPQFFSGQAGTNGAISRATTGLMVMGGAGGGQGSSTVSNAGFGFTGPANTLGGLYPDTYAGGAGWVGSTPGQQGRDGVILANFLLNIGGAGGGGGSNTLSPGAGGNGAPGCGGGASGSAVDPTGVSVAQGPGGSGGPGFVIIISW